MAKKTIIPKLRNRYKRSMIRSALAGRLIPVLYSLRKCRVLSYFYWAVIFWCASIILTGLLGEGDVLSSYFFLPFLFLGANSGKDFSKIADYYREFGGEGNRVAYYLRVSTRKQARDGRSLDEQKAAMENLILREKPSVVYGYVDPGKSGVEFDNRKVTEIVTLARNQLIDEFWVAYIDRIGRSLIDELEFICVLRRNNISIRTPEKCYDSNNLADFLILVIKCYMSEESNRKRKERANNSKRRNFIDKNWNKTAVPLGYKKNTDGWLTILEDWIPVIRDIYKYFNDGASYAGVSRKINTKNNLINDSSISSARVKSILTDPVYIGKPEHYGSVVDDSSLRLITDDLFNQVKNRVTKLTTDRRVSNEVDPLKIIAERFDISLLEFLDNIVFHHKKCGGELVKNGSRLVDGVQRQTFICKKCKEQFWIPNQTQMKKIININKEKKETINPLEKTKGPSSRKKGNKKKRKHSKNGKLDDYLK
jgi:DNA invertase Pin-like site-specific DNA recombinase